MNLIIARNEFPPVKMPVLIKIILLMELKDALVLSELRSVICVRYLGW